MRRLERKDAPVARGGLQKRADEKERLKNDTMDGEGEKRKQPLRRGLVKIVVKTVAGGEPNWKMVGVRARKNGRRPKSARGGPFG